MGWARNTAQAVNAYFRELSETNNAVTAGSTQTQAGATGLKLGFNRVTSASANDGVKLPFSEGGEECVIRNDSGAAIQIWPPSGSAIDDGSSNAVDGNTLADNAARTYKAMSSTDWYTVGNS